ncbi:MAG TPA: ABC transporter permease, partial [Acidimicrobiales bacterium]|nr:ABC transporter permease [Acidimicrobiales bacterium]
SGIFNFAHGTIAALVAFAFYDLRERQGLPWPLALALCLGVLAPLIGIGVERIARRLADAPVATKVVATIGMIVAIQQGLVIRYGSTLTQVEPFLPTRVFRILGVNVGADQLIVMALGLAGMLGLTAVLRSRLGRQMRAVVDQPDLLALMGTSPVAVRRRAWMIGCVFAGLSGVLLATTVGLEVTVLSLLVVQAFGAAAIGMFTNIPLSYAGGLAIGIVSALSTKYVAEVTWLNGLPPSVPFLVLFAVLVAAPSRWLLDFTGERKPVAKDPLRVPRPVLVGGSVLLVVLGIVLPGLVGTRLPVFTAALAYVIIYLSLALLLRTSGQVSLAQLAFAAVGGAASAQLISEGGVPWFLGVGLGALVAVPVGAVLAIPAIRRSGLYLALATFGFGILAQNLIFPMPWTFGVKGQAIIRRPGFLDGDLAFYYYVLAIVL